MNRASYILKSSCTDTVGIVAAVTGRKLRWLNGVNCPATLFPSSLGKNRRRRQKS